MFGMGTGGAPALGSLPQVWWCKKSIVKLAPPVRGGPRGPIGCMCVFLYIDRAPLLRLHGPFVRRARPTKLRRSAVGLVVQAI